MLLCAASREYEMHDSVVLGLGDNMAELLSFDRGRARDYELLGLVRRGCAIQIACNIRWSRRYVETDRNVSDADSRVIPIGAPDSS